MSEQLTNGRKVSRQTWFVVDKKKRMEAFDGVIGNSQPTELLLKINNVLNESFDEIKKFGINESRKNFHTLLDFSFILRKFTF